MSIAIPPKWEQGLIGESNMGVQDQPDARLCNVRLLVVEDNSVIGMELVEEIREFGGEAVGPVSTVRQARDLAGRERLDGVLLDVSVDDGSAACLAVELIAKGLPVLVVTGFSHDALPDGLVGFSYLEKPFSHDHLLTAIQALISSGRGESPQVA